MNLKEYAHAKTSGQAPELRNLIRGQDCCNKQVKPVVDKVFPLEETEQAMRYMDAGKQFGKIVVKVGE